MLHCIHIMAFSLSLSLSPYQGRVDMTVHHTSDCTGGVVAYHIHCLPSCDGYYGNQDVAIVEACLYLEEAWLCLVEEWP